MNKCLKRRTAFRLLASYPNVEVKRYNCASLLLPWRYSYRLHDKYLIVDDSYSCSADATSPTGRSEPPQTDA